MVQEPLPLDYAKLSEEETRARIQRARETLGSRLVILGHHYQRDEILEHADFRGDSYKLCIQANQRQEAEFIVFCGVHFMAESADILTDKRVILPNLAAGCSMADMANIFQVKRCWSQLTEILAPNPQPPTPYPSKTHPSSLIPHPSPLTPNHQPLTPFIVIPVTYINSAANLKAFVGENGGTVCTSTNAPVAVEWALTKGEKVLFFPDQHLGRNTGVKLGFDPVKDMLVWDPFKPLGGNTPDQIRAAKFLLWKGHCSVHKRFTVEQIEKAKREHPDVKVLVHPECTLEVVQASDLNGSTEFIINTVANSKPGPAWAIGTEINLVSRLAKEHPDKTVFCLDPQICPCATMYRIHPSFLLWVLEELVEGRVRNEIVVPDEVKAQALVALKRMLALAPAPAAKVD